MRKLRHRGVKSHILPFGGLRSRTLPLGPGCLVYNLRANTRNDMSFMTSIHRRKSEIGKLGLKRVLDRKSTWVPQLFQSTIYKATQIRSDSFGGYISSKVLITK